MTTTVLQSKKNKPGLLKALGCSVPIILFLFFIDEGAYNFNWMAAWGNWIAFLIYLGVFSIGQCLTYFVILARYKGNYKMTLTNVIGIPLGMTLVLLFFLLLALVVKL